jgi:hypothetical protein
MVTVLHATHAVCCLVFFMLHITHVAFGSMLVMGRSGRFIVFVLGNRSGHGDVEQEEQDKQAAGDGWKNFCAPTTANGFLHIHRVL